MAHFGTSITAYRSTALGYEAEEWSATTRARFELLNCRICGSIETWGFMFGSEEPSHPRVLCSMARAPLQRLAMRACSASISNGISIPMRFANSPLKPQLDRMHLRHDRLRTGP